jgi:hypothetical protein
MSILIDKWKLLLFSGVNYFPFPHPLQVLIKVRFFDPRGHKRKTQHESAGFFVFKAFKIHFDKRLKSKKTKIAQQFWVCACDEQILGNTRQRNPFLVQNLF